MKSESDEYEDFAEIYDVFYGTLRDDIDFYCGLAEKYGDPVLELGCGTGRISIPLARRGYRVVGLDASKSMLEIFKKKLEKEPNEVRKRIEIIHADMRDFSLDKKFPLIIIPFSSIVHLTSLNDSLKAFTNAYNHLIKGGAFVFDVFIPKYEYITKRRRIEFYTRDTDEGKRLILWERAEYDLTNQLIHVDRLVEIVHPDNESKRYFWKTTLRWYTKSELELLLKLAGFNNIKVYGDFNLGEYRYEKGKMVFIAMK